jgi:uncharacterized protein (DUF2147 family)
MKISSISAVVGFLIAAGGFSTAAMADPTGEWRVADGTATVRIKKCGSGFCGFVATATTPGKDIRNPDPSKRDRSVIGIEVLFNLKPTGDNAFTGETYNADDGQIYIATLVPNGPSMEIKGCVPNGGVCGSETWTLVRK